MRKYCDIYRCLRANNLLHPKRKIRASFNRDSSVYESSEETIISPASVEIYRNLRKKKDKSLFTSTPINNTNSRVHLDASDAISPLPLSNTKDVGFSRQNISMWKNVAFTSNQSLKNDSSSVIIVTNTETTRESKLLETRISKRITVDFPRKFDNDSQTKRKTVAFKETFHIKDQKKNLHDMQSRKILLASGKWRKSLANWRKTHVNENCNAEKFNIKPQNRCTRRISSWIVSFFLNIFLKIRRV